MCSTCQAGEEAQHLWNRSSASAAFEGQSNEVGIEGCELGQGRQGTQPFSTHCTDAADIQALHHRHAAKNPDHQDSTFRQQHAALLAALILSMQAQALPVGVGRVPG